MLNITKKNKNNNKSSIVHGRKPTPYSNIIETDLAAQTGQELQIGNKARHHQLQHHPVQDQQSKIGRDPRTG